MQQGGVADKHHIRRSVSPGLSLSYFKSISVAAALQPPRVLWRLQPRDAGVEFHVPVARSAVPQRDTTAHCGHRGSGLIGVSTCREYNLLDASASIAHRLLKRLKTCAIAKSLQLTPSPAKLPRGTARTGFG